MLKFACQSSRGIVATLALGAAVIWVSPLQAAEARYVIDQLTLNMYKDTTLRDRMSPLKSGDKVEVLQVSGDYSQVQTTDGTVGWVKTSYLDADKPAALRLAAMQEELDALRSKHTDLLIEKDGEQPAASTDKELQARLAAAETARQQAESRVSELELEATQRMTEIRELKTAEQASDQGQHFLLIWIILPILTLIAGFFVGIQFLDRKIRARFGGFSPL